MKQWILPDLVVLGLGGKTRADIGPVALEVVVPTGQGHVDKL